MFILALVFEGFVDGVVVFVEVVVVVAVVVVVVVKLEDFTVLTIVGFSSF